MKTTPSLETTSPEPRREGWTRVNSRDAEVMTILAKAVDDIEFANTTAAEELILTAGSTELD